MKQICTYITALLFLGLPVFGIAQEDTDTATEANEEAESQESDEVEPIVLEEVMVQGIRSSLVDAIGIKRSYVGTMEAVSTEDFGKFPDGNLAESLARVPGIAIDRSNVEGQKIAVRGFGPEFNLVTLNGRQMPTAPEVYSGGRSFNFGDIASPGVQAVEVFKSANSTLPSGGIGATVNMVTTKPLNIEGTRKHFSLNLVEDSTSEAGGTPFESTMLFATNQGNWGFSFSGAYQERTNREEGTRESNWLSPELMAQMEGYLRVDASNPAYTNNNQRADGLTFYQEPTAYQIKDNDRTRTNAQLTFQYAWNDDVITTVDYTYSNVDFSAVGTMFGSWLGGWDTLDATINENGAFTDVVVGNRAYDHELIWQSLENENKSLGFNTAWHLNDAWSLEFDAHHSTAAVIGGELNNSIGFTTDIQGVVTHTNGGPDGINTFAYDTEFLPENYLATGATIRDGFKENEMDQIQLKAEWANLNDSPLRSIQFGVSYTDSAFSKARSIANYGAQGASAADYDDALFQRTGLGGFMNSFGPNIGTPYYYMIDPAAALAAFAANNPGLVDTADGTICCAAGPIDDNERVNETLESAYVQFNFETMINNMPLDIVAGLRYESSDTESVSLYAPTNIIRWDMIAGLIGVNDGTGPIDAPRYGSNSLLLPSVAMSLALDDNQVVRFSASKTMARPDLFALSSRIDIGSRDFFQLTAQAGNPDLDPLQSTNIDLSYENYYREGSYFAVNLFHKDIKDFIGTRSIEGVNINGLTDPSQSAMAQMAMACVRAWVDAGRPDTLFPGDEGATGHCVSQQALWAQGWMNDQQHMGWVALAMANGVDVSEGYPWAHAGLCGYEGWWRCDPGYIDGAPNDPLASFTLTEPFNLNKGSVHGIEVNVQHLFANSPFGVQFNYTKISGGDVDIDRNAIGEQFILPGLGDSGNFSVFYEDDRHTARIALNYRGETVAGFGNYDQPLYVEEREQIDASYHFRWTDATTVFLEISNVTDEPTRLYARHPEMLFLSQDHGPIYKLGFRTNF
ncbi:MAG: TonB-dependent receptor [Xanthomonadales bacterium]|nr:TonB-dependent receptor [Xanthomonadales bacterium]